MKYSIVLMALVLGATGVFGAYTGQEEIRIERDFRCLCEMLKWCESDEPIGLPDSRTSKLLKCKEIDELGGQVSVTALAKKTADAWVNDNLTAVSRYYLASLPKRGLAQDSITMRRQEMVMGAIKELRIIVRYGCAQCISYGISLDDYVLLAKQYGEMTKSLAWKTIGDRQPKKAQIAARELLGSLTEIKKTNEQVFDRIIQSKLERYKAFAAKHPATAQTAAAVQRARKAEETARDAKLQAENAENIAREALERANNSDGSGVYIPLSASQIRKVMKKQEAAQGL